MCAGAAGGRNACGRLSCGGACDKWPLPPLLLRAGKSNRCCSAAAAASSIGVATEGGRIESNDAGQPPPLLIALEWCSCGGGMRECECVAGAAAAGGTLIDEAAADAAPAGNANAAGRACLIIDCVRACCDTQEWEAGTWAAVVAGGKDPTMLLLPLVLPWLAARTGGAGSGCIRVSWLIALQIESVSQWIGQGESAQLSIHGVRRVSLRILDPAQRWPQQRNSGKHCRDAATAGGAWSAKTTAQSGGDFGSKGRRQLCRALDQQTENAAAKAASSLTLIA